VATGRASGHFTVTRGHMAPNGFLHAASVIALVDSACGYACVASLPEGATGFTTIELKANYLGTAKEGEVVACTARLAHGGRMTQVWDAEAVNRTTGKTMALFRCTQMVLWPR
jgi:1,4-dihydroxy-2-naphthoyl-CoA hydrolase